MFPILTTKLWPLFFKLDFHIPQSLGINGTHGGGGERIISFHLPAFSALWSDRGVFPSWFITKGSLYVVLGYSSEEVVYTFYFQLRKRPS